MKQYIRLTLFFLFFYNNIFSQIPGLSQFTTNNGLPSNTIYDVITDDAGFLWIASDYGISKFDGISFTNYTVSDGLPGNEILFFYKDTHHRIWLSAFNGSIGFIKNGKFHNQKTDAFLKKLNFNSFVRGIYEDSNGSVWFCKNYRTIKVLSKNLEVKNIVLKKDEKPKFAAQIIEDKNKNTSIFAYYTIRGKIRLVTKQLNQNYNTNNWQPFVYKNYNSKAINTIKINAGFLLKTVNDTIQRISSNNLNQGVNYLAKINDIDNNYWITNLNQGVSIYNKNNLYKPPKIILPSIRTTRAFVDNEHNIWIGSISNGLYFFPNLNVNGIQFDGKNKNDLRAINFFNNKLVVGNEQSQLLILNPKTLETTSVLRTSITSERIRKLKKHNGLFYVASDFNLNSLTPDFKLKKIKNIYSSKFIKSRLVNFKDITFSQNNLFTANSNGIAKIGCKTNTISKLWNNRSTSVYYKNDSLWIGTTKGLYLSTKNKIQKFNIGKKFNNSIIYAIENSPFGLLIGSNSYGLGILKNGEFKSISTKDGLLSNYIKSIFMDTQNNIWLSTNFGLNRLELNSDTTILKIKSYTISDGLYSNDVRACYVKNNNVYVATSSGLNVIDLSKESNTTLAPKIHINEISVNNSVIHPISNQKFNFKQNNIEFNFSGISFKSMGNIRFKYRLKGLEKVWIETTNQTIHYSALPPGNYNFEIKAISKSNTESSKIAHFSFIIKPIFYTTWWFKTVAILFILLIIGSILFNHFQKIKKDQKLQEKITSLRYQALNAQMNPHFMNNLLVNINELATKGLHNEVKQSLQNFSELVNLTLQATKSNLISLANEIEMTKLYLELQKLRFNKTLSYTIDVSTIPKEDIDYIMVPPMIIQPIVENSLKHGFKNGTKKNNIQLKFNLEGTDFLICEILDNGIGINAANSETNETGISIKNIRERLQFLSEKTSKQKFIYISNIKDEFNNLVGLKVLLKIPLIII